jgi:hypothetical protein
MELDNGKLARICEQQAALCHEQKVREELKAMAREYRGRAERPERELTVLSRSKQMD